MQCLLSRCLPDSLAFLNDRLSLQEASSYLVRRLPSSKGKEDEVRMKGKRGREGKILRKAGKGAAREREEGRKNEEGEMKGERNRVRERGGEGREEVEI